MIVMRQITTPYWAPPYARHVVERVGDESEKAMKVIAPLLLGIYEELDRRVNEFANDPDKCFLTTSDGFPRQSELSGQYYVGSETYEGDSDQSFFRLWVFLRCLEKEWRSDPGVEGYDYLGLEAIVTVSKDGRTIEFDPGFNTSSI